MITNSSFATSSLSPPKINTGFKVLIVVSLALTIFSFLAVMSQLTSGPGLASLRNLSQLGASFFGINGLAFSFWIFTLSISGIACYACIWVMLPKSSSLKTTEPQVISPKSPLPIDNSAVSTPQEPTVRPAEPIVGPVMSNIQNSCTAMISVKTPNLNLGSESFRPNDYAQIDLLQVLQRKTAFHSMNSQALQFPSILPKIQPPIDNCTALAQIPTVTHGITLPGNSHGGFSMGASLSNKTLILNLGPENRLLIDLEQVDLTQLEKLLHGQIDNNVMRVLIQQFPSVASKVMLTVFEQLLIEDDDLTVIPTEAVNGLPKGDFHTYVKKVSPEYLPVYKALHTKGEDLMKMFANTKKEDPNSPEKTIAPNDRRSYGAAFVWYLMAEAERRDGKGFVEGMFVLHDDDYRIHDFFVSKASPRASTHYKQTRLTSYGMDITQDYQSGLPGGHQTMHFGKRKSLDGKCYTFVKPESWGTESLTQIIGHGLSWLISRIPHLLGYASQEGQYKEHFGEIDVAFSKLIKEIAPSDNPSIRKWGVAGFIRYLRDFVKSNQNQLNFASQKQLIKAFFEKHHIAQINGADAAQGSEVVIADSQSMKELNEPLQELMALLK